jgi:hypothetical protein
MAMAALVIAGMACGGDAAQGPDAAGGTGEEGGAQEPVDAGSMTPAPICAQCDGSCEEAIVLDDPWHLPEPIDYDDPPPAGGPHAQCWGAYGVYRDTPLPASRWVHNLEHGAVVFLYHCPEGCEAEVASLETLVSMRQRTILTPYPDMAPGFAAVAWGRRLVAGCLDVEALAAFYTAYFDQAPESVAGGPPSGC